jgi:3-oxoacyl-(acyl-carrier-protein) synthase
MRVIERGAADACLTGGAEYKLNPMAFLRQVFAGRLADVAGDADPAAIVRPFDPRACGTVIGEGGGILVVEAADTAAQRGAKAYARVAGFAARQSACRDAAGLHPAPDDHSLAEAICAALDDAKVNTGAIDAIVPLGSSIAEVDETEAAALRAALGERAATTPLITTTPFAGNCIAGNGAVAISVAAKALLEQHLPARLNTQGGRGLMAEAAAAQPAALRTILVLTTSQGGQTAAVVLTRANGSH